MAKLDRKDVKIFAENSKETLITEFRTEDSQGSTASFSRDPDVIQNENYSQGWVNNTNNLNTKIYGEDLNAVNYVLSYLLKYLYENGIAEWKNTTTYYKNSIARVDDVLYISLIDDNTGNDPTSTVGCWRAVVLDTITSTIAGTGSDIVKGITGNQITFKSISVDGYGSIQDDGDNINIHILGGSGIVDAYWGQIKGTLSNQTDLVSALGAKQDTITVNAPLSIDVDNEISIPKATTLASGYLDVDDFNTFNGKQDTLTGFSHTYDSNGDEATIVPSASNSNIGTDLAPITNINGLHLKVDTIGNQTSGVGHIDFSSSIHINNGNLKAWNLFHNYSNIQMAYTNENDVNFKLGTRDDPSSGSYYFNINDNQKLRIKSDSIIPTADILPPDNTYDLGSSTRTFAEGYINNLNTATITNKYTEIDSIEFLNQTTTGHYVNYNAGTNANNYGTHVFKSGGGVKFAIFENMVKSYVNLIPEGSWNLGASNNRWQTVYAVTVNQSSDVRLKENVKDYEESAIEKIEKLRPVTFNFKEDTNKTKKLGLIAQELREEEPLCVLGAETEDEYLGIDSYALTVFCLKAIKELNEKVKTLEARIQELEK